MSDVFDPGRRWTVSKTNSDYLRYLSAKFSISPVLAQVLMRRGVRSPEQVRQFLEPDLGALHDPFSLPDMEAACRRIHEAADRKERVLVVGDYDADGLTSTAILTDVLERLGISHSHIIPNRLSDGYGLKQPFLEEAVQRGARLVITVDCGISAVDEAEHARSLGLDLIITDHHRQTGSLPRAAAVVDPYRKESAYPFPDLAGVGVVYKMAEALLGREAASDYLDLVAIGTVADIVPLLDENRILVRSGLDMLKQSPRCGIRALCTVAGLEPDALTSGRISFVLVPRLNAAGRIGDSGLVVELLRTTDPMRASELAARLDEANRERQKLDSAVFQAARSMTEAAGPSDVAVLGSEDWHVGVLGIAAARLADHLKRPVFLLNTENGLAKGSGRSIPSFNLVSALESCQDLLEGFGGHHQAAGIRLQTDRMAAFRERMAELFRERVSADDLVPSLTLDAEVTPDRITMGLVRELEHLEPFGHGNESPVLGCKGLSIVSSRVVGRNHLKFRFSGGASHLDAILFDAGNDALDRMSGCDEVDVAFIPKLNVWEGRESVQMHVKALRSA